MRSVKAAHACLEIVRSHLRLLYRSLRRGKSVICVQRLPSPTCFPNKLPPKAYSANRALWMQPNLACASVSPHSLLLHAQPPACAAMASSDGGEVLMGEADALGTQRQEQRSASASDVALMSVSVPVDDEIELFPLPTWKDFTAGTGAGISITLVGHPFDTIKVRLQTQDLRNRGGLRHFAGGLDCAVYTVRYEGPTALYKGMSGPLATVPLINACVFSSYEQGLSFFRRWERHRLMEAGHWGDEDRLSDVGLNLNQIAMAGGWAGLVNTAIVGPVELVKSRLQIQFESTKDKGAAKFKGPKDVIADILKKRGVRGLYLGTTATVAREVPAYMGQFYAYEAFKRLFTSPGETTADLGPGALMTAGGLAGVAAWLVSYPQDVIKSRIQVQSDGRARKYKPLRYLPIDGGMVACAKSIYSTKGLKGFTVGLGPCMGRAIPANAAGFLTYEWVAKFLHAKEDHE